MRLADESGAERVRRQLAESAASGDRGDGASVVPWALDGLPRLTPQLLIPGDIVRALSVGLFPGRAFKSGNEVGFHDRGRVVNRGMDGEGGLMEDDEGDSESTPDAQILLMVDAPQLAIVLAEVDRMHRAAALSPEDRRRFVNSRLRQVAVQLHDSHRVGQVRYSHEKAPPPVRIVVAAVQAAGGRVLEADDGSGRPSSPFLAALKRYHREPEFDSKDGASTGQSRAGGSESPKPPLTPTMKNRQRTTSTEPHAAPASPASSSGRTSGLDRPVVARRHKLSMMAGTTGRRGSMPRLSTIDSVVRCVQAVARVWLWKRKTMASLSGWLLRGAPSLEPKRPKTLHRIGGTPSPGARESGSSGVDWRPHSAMDADELPSAAPGASKQIVRPATAESPSGHDVGRPTLRW